MKDVRWFKENFELLLAGYDIEYRYYENGDFGNLDQVEFNSDVKGGEIDFWSSGWLGIHLVNYSSGNELQNIFLNPEQTAEQEVALAELKKMLLD
jgi:hypothetical protein